MSPSQPEETPSDDQKTLPETKGDGRSDPPGRDTREGDAKDGAPARGSRSGPAEKRLQGHWLLAKMGKRVLLYSGAPSPQPSMRRTRRRTDRDGGPSLSWP